MNASAASAGSPREIFLAALDIEDEQRRRAYLDQSCGSDAERRIHVEKLLAAHAAGAASPLDRAVEQLAPDATLLERATIDDTLLCNGEMIDRYKLREQIGDGGMGVVYVAEQTEPVRRKVALKVIKPGMDSKEVIARFEAERQALALMDHPNVARVIDAGTTQQGRPYFVMELVRGFPITEYCDQAGLGTRQRLELFVKVCQAVQHAHQKGIIHRDLKPSNVMVTLHDGVPVPKVIDFGVAKALNQKLTEQTIYTQHRQLIGTPAYMSPEQAEMSGLDVDTRSDVYSLGVLLYELLTGTTPFDKQTLEALGFDEMRRLIREQDPPRPSQRISTLDASAATTLQQQRGFDRRQLSQSLRRELDWIVMRALEKDRNRRYESATALAEDVQRYLDDEPVEACPPTIGYRLRKYAARHKVLLATTTLVLLTALVGTMISLRYARQSSISAAAASQSSAKATSALAEAERHAAEAEQATLRAQTLLYTADMKLASDAIANGDAPRAAELLRRHIPQPGEPDLRGFEWHYFHKLVSVPAVVTLDVGRWVDDVEVSPDGEWLAVTAPDGVSIYDTSTWTQQRTFPSENPWVDGLAWSPDGQMLAGACDDGTVKVWDFASGELQLEFVAHVDYAQELVFDPDGQSLYTCGEDNFARKWDMQTGAEMLSFTGHERPVRQVAIGRDGRLLATASSDGSFAVWEADTGKLVHRHDLGAAVWCVAYAPDGRFLAAADTKVGVHLAEARSGRLLTLARQVDSIEALEFFGNGRWLGSADAGGGIQLHAVPERWGETSDDSSAQLRWLAHEGRALCLAVTHDGKSLISGGRDGKVGVWTPDLDATRWSTPAVTFRRNPPDAIFGGCATGAGTRLYVATNGIAVWDLVKRSAVKSLTSDDAPWIRIACSGDGRSLVAVDLTRLVLFDLESNRQVRTWAHTVALPGHRLAISPNGRYIAMADFAEHQFVFLYDREGGDQPRRYPSPRCSALAFSPDGRWLAAGVGGVDDVHVWDLKSGGNPLVLKGHSNSIDDLAFSPDGEVLASVSNDRLLKLWRPATGEQVYSIVAHRDGIETVAFSPDGRTIATAGEDRQVKLWHTATGQPLGSLPKEERDIWQVQFSGDGRHLVASVGNYQIVVYDASPVDTQTPRAGRETSDAAPAARGGAEFTALEVPEGKPGRKIWIEGVSADGRFAVGRVEIGDGYQAFRWSEDQGFQLYETDKGKCQASAISDDGSILCGSGNSDDGKDWVARIWTAPDESQQIGPHFSHAEDISADGTVVVGYHWSQAARQLSAFRWHNGTFEALPGSAEHRHAWAIALSPAGDRILGVAYNTDPADVNQLTQVRDRSHMLDATPVVWDANGLHRLPGFDPTVNWWPKDWSADGSVIVGHQWPRSDKLDDPTDPSNEPPFRWESGSATLLELPADSIRGSADGVTSDGRILFGYAYGGTWGIPFVRDRHWGTRPFHALLVHAGASVVGSGVAIRGISSDGTTFFGTRSDSTHEKPRRGLWRAVVPPETFLPSAPHPAADATASAPPITQPAVEPTTDD
jgi:eukaryotic-like serine/threonine-protein kinase